MNIQLNFVIFFPWKMDWQSFAITFSHCSRWLGEVFEEMIFLKTSCFKIYFSKLKIWISNCTLWFLSPPLSKTPFWSTKQAYGRVTTTFNSRIYWHFRSNLKTQEVMTTFTLFQVIWEPGKFELNFWTGVDPPGGPHIFFIVYRRGSWRPEISYYPIPSYPSYNL